MLSRKYFLLTTVMSLLLMKNAFALELLSPAFIPGGNLPLQYTCDGNSVSPPLFWKDVPAGTKSFVLMVEDPDAPSGTWDHWLLYNIPATTTALAENLQQLPEGSLLGKNSWNKQSYGAPCPPEREHRYFFKLYAMSTLLPNSPMSKQELEAALKGHVIASTELMAKYQRAK